MATKRTRRWALAACSALAIVAAPGLAAEDADDLMEMSLEDLLSVEVTSASKFAQNSSEAPFYTSGQRTFQSGTPDENLPAFIYRPVPSRVVTNLNLVSADLLPRLTLSAGVYDLFDVDAAHTPGFEHDMNQIVQDGRTFRMKMTWAFGVEN